MSDRITFRPGDLAGPLAAWCKRHGTTPSETTRLALSKMLRVDAPPMDGHVAAIMEVNARRLKPSKKKKARK